MKKTILWTIGLVTVLFCVALVGAYIVLSRYDFNSFKPRIASAVHEATGRDLTIAGDIDFEIGFAPALLIEGIRFQNAAWGSRPDMVRVERLEIQLGLWPLLSGRIDIKRFILMDADILIETDRQGRLNTSFDKAPPKKQPPKPPADQKPPETPGKDWALPAVAFDHVRIQNSRFTYRDGRTGQATTLLIKKLTLKAPGFDQPVQLALESTLNEAIIALSGTLGPLQALTDPDKNWPLKLDINALGTTLAIAGGIQDAVNQKGIAISFDFQLKDRATLEKFLKTTLPAIVPLKLVGKVSDTGPKAFRISGLEVTLGPSIITGNGAIDLASKPPKIKADFSSEKLDLRPWIKATSEKPSKPAAPKAKKPSNPDKVFPDDPLPLDALKALEADIRFKAGQILLPKLTIAQVNAAVRLKAGRLTLNPLTAVIGGGRLDSSLSLSAKGAAAAITAKLKIDKLGIGAITKGAGLPGGIEGVLDVDLDLNASGASVAELMAELDGHVSLIVDDGRIHNKYIDLLSSDLVSGLLGLLNPARSKKDYTAVNCLVTRFDVKTGLAKLTALLFDSDLMRVDGEGKIDLGSEVLDLKLTPQPKKSLATEKGFLGLSLSDLAQPFLVGGTLAKPAITIDKADAALALGKTIGSLLGQGAAAPSGTTGDDKDPCMAAVAAARSGVPVQKQTEVKQAGTQTKTTSPPETLKDLPDLGKALKSLFGN